MPSKSFTLLALTAFAGIVTAGTAPFTCSKQMPGPDGTACAKSGFLSGEEGKLFAVERLSLEECAAYCAANEGCQTISYRDSRGGRCTMYGKALGDLNWFDDTYSWDVWYEMGCFGCSNNALFDINFNAVESLDDWSMTTETDDTFFFDTQSVDGRKVFRVLEATDSGSARIFYSANFPLEPGATYRLGFQVKTNKPGETDLGKLELFVAAHDELIFEYSPEEGSKAGQVGDWGVYTPEFTVHPVDAGQGSFELSITAGGQQLDWFFSYIYLQKV